ncbi:phosphatase PAP2 family protein [Adhaeribacter rhizoryzae]|uniref:Phosphatase PAP2 family protein n=1 Tax=Adhaeribacter rhizoryzae TaxID=2607907 RepID=A0A5M6D2I6_9BACT|nr:phosphatase PAP2 family protein [Adhaeribacter rhizoryzae]KAA5541688.1 phosphatase PAP2 family protein [Adhaeribacter rhizoryzae]
MSYIITRLFSGLFLLISHLSVAQTEPLAPLSVRPLLTADSLYQAALAEPQSKALNNNLFIPETPGNLESKVMALRLFYNQNLERLAVPLATVNQKYDALNPQVKRFALPAALVGIGFVGLGRNHIFDYDAEIHEDIMEEHAGFRTTIDDHTRLVPLVAVYGLNLAGIKGKHNLVELSIIALTTDYLSGIITNNIKTLTREHRPDGSNDDSFPSGHTSSAFSKATILWQEYKDVSIWYGVGGYAFASATGALRMLNKKHWLSDVLAGAGVGILTTQAVYAVYPWVQQKIKHTIPALAEKQLMVMPAYTQGSIGFSMVYALNKPNQAKYTAKAKR